MADDAVMLAPWNLAPWDSEPDQVSWIDLHTGLRCMIIRQHELRALCGYVEVPQAHPAHGLHYDGELLRGIGVHGGLTFAGPLYGQHKDHQDMWWLGFDCAHGGDLVPGLVALRVRFKLLGTGPDVGSSGEYEQVEIYRDMNYVTEQCELLAAQLVALKVPPPSKGRSDSASAEIPSINSPVMAD